MNKLDEASQIFKALSDPTRLRIIKLLAGGKILCVSAISNKLDVAQPVISQHLKTLRTAELVTAKRMGFYIHYSLNVKTISSLVKHVKELS